MNFDNFRKNYEKVETIEFQNTVSNSIVISICIVTYNHIHFIKKCLDSILSQQTKFPFEILLGEDASTDGTRDFCIEYAKKYPDRIRLFLHHRENNINLNGTPSGRFNFIYNLHSSKGKYIALCEGDDYWTDPLKLQKQVDFLEKNDDYNICFHNASNLEGDQITTQIYSPNRKQTITLTDLFKGDFTKTCCVLFRNNIDISDIAVEMIQDTTLFMKCLENNKKAYYINEDMAVYRIHAGGIFSLMKIKDKLLQAYKIRSYIYNKYKQHPDSYIIQKTLKEISIELCLIYLKTFEMKSFYSWWVNSRKYKAKIPLRKYYHLAKKHLITH